MAGDGSGGVRATDPGAGVQAMTIDDLVKIADKAEAEIEWVLKEGDGQRAGMRAVVKALRDAVVLKIDAHNGCGILATETAIDATRDVFDEIMEDSVTCQSCGGSV